MWSVAGPRFAPAKPLQTFFSMEMREAVEHILFNPDHTQLSTDNILNKIKHYVRSQRNIALDCVAFEERKQNAGEIFDAFLIAIKTLARNADLCDACLDRSLVTKIMSGIRDKETRIKLLATSPLPDLQKVTDLCRSEESAKLDDARMNKNQIERNVYRARAKSREFGPKSHDCRKCGRSTCPLRGLTVCPVKDSTCSKCNKKGHFASVCYSRNRSQPQQYLSDSKKKSNG